MESDGRKGNAHQARAKIKINVEKVKNVLKQEAPFGSLTAILLFRLLLKAVSGWGTAIDGLEGSGEMIDGVVAYQTADFVNLQIAVRQIILRSLQTEGTDDFRKALVGIFVQEAG